MTTTSTPPEEGEYLASHWNIGSPLNRFLGFGGLSANRLPFARDDAATAEKSVARDVAVLANDTDLDADQLAIASVADPAHGSAGVNPGAQSIRNRPDPGYVGSDSFTYRIDDGRGGEAAATARISVRDTVAPRVIAVSPAPGATNVSRSPTMTARFSEPMKAGTLNRTTVKLVRKGATSPVGATVRYNSTSRLVTLEPSAPLARGATYNATVTRGARDPSGNALAAARTWSFTVRR